MYNIDALARLTGLARRTIRYYVQRGVLDPPEGGGRGSYYTEEHRSRLEQIKAWSEQGVPLIHMKGLIEKTIELSAVTRSPAQQAAPPEPATQNYERFQAAKGVEIHFVPGCLRQRDLEEIQGLIQDLTERRNHVD